MPGTSEQIKDLTTSQEGKNVMPLLQANSHFFLEDYDFTQQAAKRFGALSEEEFRTTNTITFNGNNGSEITDSRDTGIAIWLPLERGEGMHTVENEFNAAYKVSFTSSPLNFDFDFAQSGSITLTQTSGEFITGTFTATVTKDYNTTITIENGEFKALGIE